MVDATEDCQLGCRYCYFGQKCHHKMNVDKIFEAILRMMRVFKIDAIKINYMGGEPLMAWKEILQLNKKLKDANVDFRWGMTSNLISLDEDKTQHMISEKASIHASIDGDEKSHNLNRPYRDGRPSYVEVAKNIPNALKITPRDTARVTITPETAGSSMEICDSLFDKGYHFKHHLFP